MNKMTKFNIFILALFCSMVAFAQNNKGKTDDIGRIVLTPYVVSNANIPSYALSVIENKLAQIAAKHGMAGNSADMRFVITANLVEVSKDITATTPPMVALKFAPTLYIGDIVTGELFASCDLPIIRGVGENETKAYMGAIKALQVNNPAVAKCINEGKEKIVEYYNSQIDFILAEAESLVKAQQYDEAMVMLASVPNICKDAYLKAFEKIGEVYQKKIDLEGEKLYNEAYATWNTAKTKESASKVVELVAAINPISSAAAKGRELVKMVESRYAELEARRREIEERNWAFKMKQYEDEQENRAIERENDHEYRMMKAGMDYEVQMEYAKKADTASQYALQEVKEIVTVMSTHEAQKKSKFDKMVDKIKGWFN